MSGKTINDLSALTTVTANDLLAIWDADAGAGVEPTKKITAEHLAAGLRAIGSPITAIMLGGSEYTAVLHTGQFEMGILVGQYRDQGDIAYNGYCIVFVYNGIAYMSAKTGLSGTTSVSYSNGVLTVNTSVGYMNYAFIKLIQS